MVEKQVHRCPDCGAIVVTLRETQVSKMLGLHTRLIHAINLLNDVQKEFKEITEILRKKEEPEPEEKKPEAPPLIDLKTIPEEEREAVRKRLEQMDTKVKVIEGEEEKEE